MCVLGTWISAVLWLFVSRHPGPSRLSSRDLRKLTARGSSRVLKSHTHTGAGNAFPVAGEGRALRVEEMCTKAAGAVSV